MIYNILLAVMAFFLGLGALSTWFVSRSPTTPRDTVWVMQLIAAEELAYAAFAAIILVVRLAAPKYRKWPTVVFNICLLAFFPIGTALGIYGLWKVDKAPAESYMPSSMGA